MSDLKGTDIAKNGRHVADPNVWSGRASQENFVELAVAVLHQCIRPLIGAFWLLAMMDISAPAISLADRPRLGHLGHQCSQAPGRPNLHLVSFSRRPRQVKRIDLTTSLRAPHFRALSVVVCGVEDQADCTTASSILRTSKARPRARTLQAMRASLLASAIASTL